MQINADLAQRIVDIIIPVVHRNVNLMNLRGVIIASGHRHRIGTVHTGARLAIETGSTIEIFPDELDRYPGALQGINMPIFRDERAVGVVGVFGDPPNVRSTAQLVKMITELVLERETLQRESGSNRRMREELAQLLLAHDGSEIPAAAHRLAHSMGFDVEQPRVVVQFRAVDDAISVPGTQLSTLGLLSLTDLEARLRGDKNLHEADFIAFMEGALVVLFAAAGQPHDLIVNHVQALRRTLAHVAGLPIRAGIGGCALPGQFAASWRQAIFAVERTTRRHAVRDVAEEALLADYLRQRMMSGDGAIAAYPLVARVQAAFGERPVLRDTIETLLRENIDGTATASVLGIHRNTLSYRLKQFFDLTGLVPTRRFADAILCWIALGAAPAKPSDDAATSPVIHPRARREAASSDRMPYHDPPA